MDEAMLIPVNNVIIGGELFNQLETISKIHRNTRKVRLPKPVEHPTKFRDRDAEVDEILHLELSVITFEKVELDQGGHGWKRMPAGK